MRKSDMTVTELCARAGVSHTTVANWATIGVAGVQLRTRWVGGKRLIAEADYRKFDRQVNEAKRQRHAESLLPA